MSNDTFIVLSVILAVVVVAVLAVALILAWRGLTEISEGLATLESALDGVESQHLRAARARGQGDQRPVRRDPRGPAGDRAQGGDRRREEAAVTLLWIGNAVLLLVILPVVVVLLRNVLNAARSIVPSVEGIAARGRGRARRTSTPRRCCSPPRSR